MKKLIVISLMIGMLVSCSSPLAQQEVSEASTSQLKEKPIELTVFLNSNNIPFNPEWPVWKEIGKRMNISFSNIISPSHLNEKQAFDFMLSFGKLADIIGFSDIAQLEKLGQEGGLLPLNNLIDTYAPNIKKLLETDENFAKAAYAPDGNIYQIPKNQILSTDKFWWIRQDWLDKLNLKAPKTVQELYFTLKAFREKDPNGNGEKDEIPLFDSTGEQGFSEYLALWDTSLGFYPRNGRMTFEPLEPNFRTGVRELAKWYKEGLIDPEIFTRGSKSRDVLLKSNQGGMTHDGPIIQKNDKIEGFELKAIAPPANQYGVIKERTSRLPSAGWGISTQCKDPVAAIQLFDYLFTEEGSDLMNWGIEGQTYERKADGTKVYLESVMQSEQTPTEYLQSQGIQYRVGMTQMNDAEFALMTKEVQQATELYLEHQEWYADQIPPYSDGVIQLKYSKEDEAEYRKIMSEIRPYVEQQFQSWILGVSQIDQDYYDFVKQLKSFGIDRAIEINQKAYREYLVKHEK